ncbi:uncharacterized protein CLUP02_13923 [Colletotrichum lupini]|uniref:Uncharacterized protein n=1 Tax=Colletotrichum lupini TaxID=145971 RepID=A0A9Q8T391_9PEZI|nr:uncharacterized protein CLUP02_13923 [Colletotrichum lupini]UQC88399.1 hypothetical protein CLUP02_13923 [Colletotrichum lupini]
MRTMVGSDWLFHGVLQTVTCIELENGEVFPAVFYLTTLTSSMMSTILVMDGESVVNGICQKRSDESGDGLARSHFGPHRTICIVDQKPFGASWDKFEKRLAQRKADDNPIDRERRRGGEPKSHKPPEFPWPLTLSHSSHGDPTGLSGHWQQRVPKWVTHTPRPVPTPSHSHILPLHCPTSKRPNIPPTPCRLTRLRPSSLNARGWTGVKWAAHLISSAEIFLPIIIALVANAVSPSLPTSSLSAQCALSFLQTPSSILHPRFAAHHRRSLRIFAFLIIPLLSPDRSAQHYRKGISRAPNPRDETARSKLNPTRAA